MVYLRARFYSPDTGRFLTKDTFAGNYAIPLSMNGWNYTHSNPVNLTDPTGHFISPTGPQTCGSYIFSNGFLPNPNITAQGLVELCKGFYNQSFWRSFSLPGGVGNYDCDSLNRTIWGKPTTAAALFGDYICERGPEHVYFNGGDILTQKLSRSVALDKIRREFYQHGTIYPREEEFGDPFTYFNEWRDLQVDPEFPLFHVMGSFDVSVTSAAGNRVKFWVHNRTDLASGTHFIGRFPPDGQADNPLTVEEVIKDNPNLANQPAWWVINTYSDNYRGNIVAILIPQLRSQTRNGLGGGIFEQTFVWTESNISCEIQTMKWPAYLHLINIGVD